MNYKPPTLERTQPTVSHLSDQLPLSILVAEDNVINQKLLVSILELQGYSPDIVADGNEVLYAIVEKNYDLILMDIQMPELGGEETTQKVKNLLQENSPKIIAVTAYAMAGDREKYLKAGMDGYLSKPFKIHELIREIKRVMN
ncbi:MAG: response regulator [Chitinophagales bacterium]|nr:response regulator [Chitinophagales bacterium]